MSTHIHHEGTSCQCMARSAAYSQNFDEMDFTRGIWSAAMNGEVDRVQNYLDKKCSPDALDSSGYTALELWYFKTIHQHGLNTVFDGDHMQAKHYAARSGHSNVCKILLISGANPNVLTRAGKASPLHRAAYSGHSDIAKILAEHGAKLDLVDIDGQTALHKAAQKSHKEVIQFLIKNNQNLLSMKDKWHKLAVDYVNETNKELQVLLQPAHLQKP